MTTMSSSPSPDNTEQVVDALVASYLKSATPNLVSDFKKRRRSCEAPKGSPTLAQLVDHYNKTTTNKRKLSLASPSKAKRAKRDGGDSSSREGRHKFEAGLRKEAASVAIRVLY